MLLPKRQRQILEALRSLGGQASTKQIAEFAKLHVNGVAQTLGVMRDITPLGGTGGDRQWQIRVR